MKNLIYGIIITVGFNIILGLLINICYHYGFIVGILSGAYYSFLIQKIFTSLFGLFCLIKLLKYIKNKEKFKNWIPISIFALIALIFTFCYGHF